MNKLTEKEKTARGVKHFVQNMITDEFAGEQITPRLARRLTDR